MITPIPYIDYTFSKPDNWNSEGVDSGFNSHTPKLIQGYKDGGKYFIKSRGLKEVVRSCHILMLVSFPIRTEVLKISY